MKLQKKIKKELTVKTRCSKMVAWKKYKDAQISRLG